MSYIVNKLVGGAGSGRVQASASTQYYLVGWDRVLARALSQEWQETSYCYLAWPVTTPDMGVAAPDGSVSTGPTPGGEGLDSGGVDGAPT